MLEMLLVLAILAAAEVTAISRRDLVDRLFNDYDNTARPFLNTTEPVRVRVQMKLSHVFNVEAKSSSCHADVFLRQTWTDPRLSWDLADFSRTVRVPTTLPWLPDLGFTYALKCEPVRDESVIIFFTGDILYSKHLQCQFAQSFNLHRFPFDQSKLQFRLQSFIYNRLQLDLRAGTIADSDLDDVDGPVEDSTNSVTGAITDCFPSPPEDELVSSTFQFSQSDCVQRDISWRPGRPKYSTLEFSIVVQRRGEHYVVKLVLPLGLLAFLSTLTYWIDLHSPPARTGFSVTLLLAVVTFNILVGQDLPKIAYNTMLDWYVMLCFAFCLVAVAEFALVSHLSSSKRWNGDTAAILIDDFFQWTLSIVFICANAIYWRLSPVSTVLGTIGLVVWVGFNLARAVWNKRNDGLSADICCRARRASGSGHEQAREAEQVPMMALETDRAHQLTENGNVHVAEDIPGKEIVNI